MSAIRLYRGRNVTEVYRECDEGEAFVALLVRRKNGTVGVAWNPYAPVEVEFPGPVSALRFVVREANQ